MFMMITNLKEDTTRRNWIKIRETSYFREMFSRLFLEKSKARLCVWLLKKPSMDEWWSSSIQHE